MIIAGEASGDLHGAALIEELKSMKGDISICGIGGDNMIAAGMDNQFHIKDMAFLGFVEVIKHLPFIRKVQKTLLEKIAHENIKTIVLIDYPGFNLNFAKKLKKIGLKVVYYISPQIWAWGQGRVKKIKQIVDKMLVILPFEKDFYCKAEVDVEYVGHPLIERIAKTRFLSRENLYQQLNLAQDKEILLLMPGSRMHEIKDLFPTLIESADELSKKYNLQIVVACSQNIDSKVFEKFSKNFDFKIATSNTYDLLNHSRFGIVKSGTSTLEAGLFSLPMIVVYSTSWLTYHIGKMLIKINNIALINIVAGEQIIDELIQDDVNRKNIVERCSKILNDSNLYSTIKEKLNKVKTKLGEADASTKAAFFVLEQMKNG